jgi:hypothetical protein
MLSLRSILRGVDMHRVAARSDAGSHFRYFLKWSGEFKGVPSKLGLSECFDLLQRRVGDSAY